MKNLVLAAFFLLSSLALASEKVQIQNISEARAKLIQLQKQYSNDQILVVFDIDNTLLTTNQFLGGDAWFNWQADKLTTGNTDDLVAPDFAGLLEAQGKLFSAGKMHAPESETVTFVQEVIAQGLNSFLLTSRGTAFQNATQKELVRNGYPAMTSAPGPRGGFAGRFTPYDVTQPQAACLTPEEVAAWKLSAAKQVVYNEGILFGEGQHKGALLRSLLCKTHNRYKAILLVDDGEKNVDRVLKAYEGSQVEVVGLRYGNLDQAVSEFQNSDKHDVIYGWAKLKSAFDQVLH